MSMCIPEVMTHMCIPEVMTHEDRDEFIKTQIALGWTTRKHFELLQSHMSERDYSLLMIAHWKVTGIRSPKNPISKGHPPQKAKKKDRIKLARKNIGISEDYQIVKFLSF